MPILGLGLVLAAVGFVLHLVRWRIAPPMESGRILILTWLAGIFGGFVLIVLLAWAEPALAERLPEHPIALLHAVLVALALAAAYVMTYPAIEVESPTLAMIQAIARQGTEGLPRKTLFEQLNDAVLVAPRIHDLLDERLAVQEGERLRLTGRGRALVRIFVLWRAVLGAPKGG